MLELNYKDGIYRYNEIHNPKDVNLKVPDVGDYYFLIHDWDEQLKAEYGLEPRRTDEPYPSSRPLRGEDDTRPYSGFVPMSDSWQERLLELFQYVAPNVPMGEPIAWFVMQKHEVKQFVPKGTVGAYPYYPEATILGAYQRFIEDHRVFTDGDNAYNSFEKPHRDINLQVNLDKENWLQKSLDTTGNIVRRINNTNGMTPIQISTMYKIDALGGMKPAPPLEWIIQNKPHCIHWATEQGITMLPDGTWVVARFPQLKMFGVGVPYFCLAKKDWNLVAKKHVRKIANGESYSPYNPEK